MTTTAVATATATTPRTVGSATPNLGQVDDAAIRRIYSHRVVYPNAWDLLTPQRPPRPALSPEARALLAGDFSYCTDADDADED